MRCSSLASWVTLIARAAPPLTALGAEQAGPPHPLSTKILPTTINSRMINPPRPFGHAVARRMPGRFDLFGSCCYREDVNHLFRIRPTRRDELRLKLTQMGSRAERSGGE